jgi:antitoxin HicB
LQSFRYPARLTLGNDGAITIKLRDLPEAITWGHDTDDALCQAADCIDEAIAGRLRRGGSIPRPSKSRAGEILVDVPARTAAKAALYLAMKDAGVRPCNEKDIQRLLDPRQAVAFTKLERALNALGKRLILAVDEAA